MYDDDAHGRDDAPELEEGPPAEPLHEPDDEELWLDSDEDPGWTEEQPPSRLGPTALAGVFALGAATCLVLVLIWGAFTGNDAGGGPAAGGTSPGQGSALLPSGSTEDEGLDESSSTVHDHATATRLSRCVKAARTLQRSLDAARPALDQWAVHVGAMNKLVVGEITLRQATAFWESTRLGAQRNVARFRDTVEAVRSQGLDCPSPALLAPGARALPGCARQVEAEVVVLRAATTSIDTWDQHVRHMDMLRLGELSPEKATQMWLSMWQEGVRDLDAYRSAAQESRRARGCDRVGQGR